jgi:hypothetical protein
MFYVNGITELAFCRLGLVSTSKLNKREESEDDIIVEQESITSSNIDYQRERGTHHAVKEIHTRRLYSYYCVDFYHLSLFSSSSISICQIWHHHLFIAVLLFSKRSNR